MSYPQKDVCKWALMHHNRRSRRASCFKPKPELQTVVIPPPVSPYRMVSVVARWTRGVSCFKPKPELQKVSIPPSRPSPSPLEAAAPTTRGGALARAKKSTASANSRTTVAAKPSSAPKRKPVITSSVTGRNLLTGWPIKKIAAATITTTTTRKSGTPSSTADGRPPSTGGPVTPPTVDLTTPPAGTGAAKRTSGGSVPMRRPSGGASTTLTPPVKEKERSPGTKRRSTQATTVPPQPGLPQRTAARKVTPAVTYVELTRGTSTVTTTMTTRRMARATSLPPVPRNDRDGGASTTQTPSTMPVTVPCTFATARTLTLTTTSIYSKPVAVVTVATRRSGGGGGISPSGLKKKIQEDTVLLESATTTRAQAARATTEPPSPPADMGPETVSDTATPTTPEERPVTKWSWCLLGRLLREVCAETADVSNALVLGVVRCSASCGSSEPRTLGGVFGI
uniref:mucin-2-like n=1 Tax=Osmia lignaria TaxID=473952 RepID=UPI001478D417|nr:mucin-2-like [Osmia lignaria]